MEVPVYVRASFRNLTNGGALSAGLYQTIYNALADLGEPFTINVSASDSYTLSLSTLSSAAGEAANLTAASEQQQLRDALASACTAVGPAGVVCDVALSSATRRRLSPRPDRRLDDASAVGTSVAVARSFTCNNCTQASSDAVGLQIAQAFNQAAGEGASGLNVTLLTQSWGAVEASASVVVPSTTASSRIDELLLDVGTLLASLYTRLSVPAQALALGAPTIASSPTPPPPISPISPEAELVISGGVIAQQEFVAFAFDQSASGSGRRQLQAAEGEEGGAAANFTAGQTRTHIANFLDDYLDCARRRFDSEGRAPPSAAVTYVTYMLLHTITYRYMQREPRPPLLPHRRPRTQLVHARFD